MNHDAFGVPEIDPGWVARHRGEVQILDVREPDEYVGPLGHIAGSVLIPLGDLPERWQELSADKPIVAVCRSGVRSVHAMRFLGGQGFTRMANLPGGMIRWRQEGLPTEP